VCRSLLRQFNRGLQRQEGRPPSRRAKRAQVARNGACVLDLDRPEVACRQFFQPVKAAGQVARMMSVMSVAAPMRQPLAFG